MGQFRNRVLLLLTSSSCSELQMLTTLFERVTAAKYQIVSLKAQIKDAIAFIVPVHLGKHNGPGSRYGLRIGLPSPGSG